MKDKKSEKIEVNSELVKMLQKAPKWIKTARASEVAKLIDKISTIDPNILREAENQAEAEKEAKEISELINGDFTKYAKLAIKKRFIVILPNGRLQWTLPKIALVYFLSEIYTYVDWSKWEKIFNTTNLRQIYYEYKEKDGMKLEKKPPKWKIEIDKILHR